MVILDKKKLLVKMTQEQEPSNIEMTELFMYFLGGSD